ncbi:hypothetical protein [Nocardia stercoris]|uniref:Molecular chaperone DnaJ n=1 Tax=Nocardia stercoris TaxID=2483361 RepID=A0A3M2LDU2_9NOCA|nr:hypothetical protein [Nocardia stercoris]RMI35196.1 hypothetical protein EBN03_02545 [Nocardia stercoris]
MNTAREAADTIAAADRPEDLFGSAATDSAARQAARRRYHRLAALVHPDRTGGSGTAFHRLNDFYRQWMSGSAGDPIAGYCGAHPIGPLHARGSVADLYRSGSDAVLKIPRTTAANRLLAGERNALGDLSDLAAREPWLRPYFPQLRDTVDHLDTGTGQTRTVNVLGALTEGFVTLAQVRAAYPGGLDPRDYAWMHRRLLRCLAGAALAGWVHTAVVPENVLIHPRLHGVVLAGWSFATRPGRPAAATLRAAAGPPELTVAVAPETDVFQAHRLMLAMLGDRAPAPMRAFATGCLQPEPRLRPAAADLLDEFDDLLDRLYGQRRFRPFDLPKGQ